MKSVFIIILPIFAYMLGSVPFGLVLTRNFAGADILKQGSGNIGATNVSRVAGWKLGVLTLIADLAKGAVPVGLAMKVSHDNTVFIAFTALCAFCGHLYPIYLKFKDGGKGVATVAGTFIIISPMSLMIAFLIFIIVVATTRRVSAGSLASSAALALSAPIFTGSAALSVCAVLMAICIWIRHKDNIRRLFSGQESAIFTVIILILIPSSLIASPVMDEDVQVYLQAINEIERYSLDAITRRDILSKSLKSYLKTTDPLSAYLTPEEYDLFKSSQKDNYIGLGIEFDTDASGRILCFPYPESSGDKAGILPGDVLESLNGEDVSSLSPLMVVAKSAGKENSEAVLKILRKDGSKNEVRVRRTVTSSASVRLEAYNEFAWIRFLAFTATTRQELQKTLADVGEATPIILDLRGNPGGDLYAATDCATLFLEKDKTIVGFKSRSDSKLYKNMTIPMNAKSPVYIWQDEGTAGASEVFIAAMVENGRAQSIGKKTPGKGIRQDIIELADGSALFITTAWLQTPDEEMLHNKGLEATYRLEGRKIGTEHYMAKFCDLILPKLTEAAPLLRKTPAVATPLPDKIRIVQTAWSLRFGLYSTADAAITAFRNAKAKKAAKALRFWVQISGYKNEADAQKDVKKFQNQGIEAHHDLENTQDTSIRYSVMIGFYPRKDDKLFNSLKKDGIIGTDAYWIQVREN